MADMELAKLRASKGGLCITSFTVKGHESVVQIPEICECSLWGVVKIVFGCLEQICECCFQIESYLSITFGA